MVNSFSAKTNRYITKMIRTKANKIIFIITLALIVAFTFAACESNGDSTKSPTSSGETAVDNEPLATILFASDYQVQEGWGEPKDNLTNIIKAAKRDEKNIDEVIICGDYTNDSYKLSPEESIGEIKEVIQAECTGITSDNILFVQGNHDRLTESISASGLHEFKDYLVYVVNTEKDFPWKQGKTAGSLSKVRNTAEEMETCLDELIENGEIRPIIIASHVPLHFSGRTASLHATGDNLYSSLVFNVVNEKAKSLNIIYIFGHNHSKGWDCYLGQSCVYMAIGDNILIPEYAEKDSASDKYTVEELNFTYMNAGYIGYCMSCSPKEADAETVEQYKAADDTLTATICEIYADNVLLTRYSEEGVYPLGSAGCANSYYDDSHLIPEKYYSKKVNSPQTVSLHKDPKLFILKTGIE